MANLCAHHRASAIKMLSRTAGAVARTTPRMALRKVISLRYNYCSATMGVRHDWSVALAF